MKNYDCWKKFFRTGKIDDYLSYIACARDESMNEFNQDAVSILEITHDDLINRGSNAVNNT